MLMQAKLLDDVSVWLLYPQGARSEAVYTVGSITADRYLAVPGSKLPAVQAFMRQLNGRQTLEEIQAAMLRENGFQLDVAALHRKFSRAGLLAQAGGGQAGDIQEMSTTFLRLPIDRLLGWFQLLSPAMMPLVLLGAALILGAIGLLLTEPSFLSLMATPTAKDMSRMGTAAMVVLIGLLSIVLHELSHCFVASRWGILTGTLRIQLYLGTIPIVGLKLAGLYTLPPRGRLAVWSAGVLTNLSITAAALLAIRTVAPGSAALGLTAAINWLLAVFNLMPLLPTDGYFMLCTLVKDSNVRVRAWDWVRRPFRRDRKRPSVFVIAYIIATVWLLLNTLRHLALRILNSGPGNPRWQSAFALVLLALFLVTLWRTFRRTEDVE
jgi:Zn-dependent protease